MENSWTSVAPDITSQAANTTFKLDKTRDCWWNPLSTQEWLQLGRLAQRFSSLFNRKNGTTNNGEQQEWLSNWWILYMDKCVNRLKKSQVDNADHHWLPSCQKYLQCRCWLEGVLFLQIDEWNQKASSCWYVGISLVYPLHKSQYLRWCGIDWDVDTQHRLLQVETR